MIFLTKNQSVPKRFASISKALESLNDLNKTLFHSLFGSGIINSDSSSLSSPGSFTLTTDGIVSEEYSLSFKYSGSDALIFSFQDAANFSSVITTIFGNQFESYYIPMDETNLVAGDVVNKVRLPSRVFVPESASQYSTKFYSSLYLNGTPQLASDSILEDDEEDGTSVGFSRVRSGSIYPEPVDSNGAYNQAAIEGASADVWVSDFGYTDPETSENFFRLQFSNFKSNSTPRILIMELTNTSSLETDYLYVSRDISSEETNLYYRLDEDRPEIVYINQEYVQTLANNEVSLLGNFFLRFYFVTKLEEFNAFEGNLSFSNKKFQIPADNLLPITSEFKVLAWNKVTNRIIDVTSISSTLIGEGYRINYENSSIELFNIIPGILSRDVEIFAADYYYSPPIQLDFGYDMANSIAIYGTKGTFYLQNEVSEDSDLPNVLYLYAYLCDRRLDLVTYTDSSAKLRTSSQLRESDLRFLISSDNSLALSNGPCEVDGNEYRYLMVGTLSRSGTDYIFSLNGGPGGITSGYDRLINLAQSVQVGGYPFNSVDVNRTASIIPSAPTPVAYVNIMNIPATATRVELYGYLTDISLLSGASPRQYSASLIIRDNVTLAETSILPITAGSSGSNYFEVVSANLNNSFVAAVNLPSSSNRRTVSIKVTAIVPNPVETNYSVSVNGNFYIGTLT